MSPKQFFEARPCGVKLPLAVFEPPLCGQDVSKAPSDLWIGARRCWRQERLRLRGLVLARVDFGEVDARLHVARKVRNRTSVPESGKVWIRHGHELPPQHAELKADPCQREGRNVIIRGKRLPIDCVSLGKALEIGEEGA